MARLHTFDAESGDTTGLLFISGDFTASNTRAHTGTYSYRSNSSNPAAAAHATCTFTGSVGTTYYSRQYVWLSAAPPSGSVFLGRWRTSTPGLLLSIHVNSIGQCYIRNDITNSQYGHTAFTMNQWVRVETSIQINSGTNDDIVRIIFNGAGQGEHTTDLGTTAPGRFEIGQINTAGGVDYVEFIDNIAINDSTGVTDNSFPGEVSLPPVIQYARPSADFAIGSWTTNTGSTSNLWDTMNEDIASDVDYAQSGNSPESSDTLEVRLQSVGDPLSGDNHIVHYRLGKDVADGDALNVTVHLVQGTTIISTDPNSPRTVPNAFTDYNWELTATEADSITNYSDLRIRFVAAKQ